MYTQWNITQNKTIPFAAPWMDLVRVTGKDHDITDMWNLKYDTNELI